MRAAFHTLRRSAPHSTSSRHATLATTTTTTTTTTQRGTLAGWRNHDAATPTKTTTTTTTTTRSKRPTTLTTTQQSLRPYRTQTQTQPPRTLFGDSCVTRIARPWSSSSSFSHRILRPRSLSLSSSSSITNPAYETLIAAKLGDNFSWDDPHCNLTPTIASRLGTNLHHRVHHPLHTIRKRIEAYFNESANSSNDSANSSSAPFAVYDDFSPIVSTHNNFDVLRIDPGHVSRQMSDTYYLNRSTVLRTHTSAHQVDLLRSGVDRFLVTGDVYRRDEIDRSHYPVFHQTEGVKIFTPHELDGLSTIQQQQQLVEDDLKASLEGLAAHLFGPTEMRWVDAYFPFTEPSFELEILFQGEWLEVLGCGVVHPEILEAAGRGDHIGWAFGLGLERLAMVLFEIPDIRLFWTNDDRFHSQFVGRNKEIVKFQPYSKYPPCYKDMSFWIHQPETFHVNDLNELVRGIAGDLVEEVVLIDDFVHPKTNKMSHCYRISYRSMDRNLTNEEIDRLQEEVRLKTASTLNVELR